MFHSCIRSLSVPKLESLELSGDKHEAATRYVAKPAGASADLRSLLTLPKLGQAQQHFMQTCIYDIHVWRAVICRA